MKFDICLPNAMEGFLVPAPFAGPKEITRFAQEAERLGYHAIWGFDFINPHARLSIPDSETPNWYELMTTLAYVSAVTDRLRLVAGVIVLPNRDPVLLAKQAASVDQFSNGRLHLGIGLGSRPEFESIQPRARGAYRGNMVDEKLEALKLLLSQENKPVSYKGEYVEFEGVNLNPKPVQNPLPMFIAAETPAPLRRAVKWGVTPILRDKDLVERKRQLEPLLEEHGKTLKEFELAVWADISIATTTKKAVEKYMDCRMGHFRNQDAETLLRDHWIGTVDEVAEKLVRIKNEGVDHVVAMHTATDTFEEMMEQAQIFAEEVKPLVEKA
ncbi:MAG: TIGR03619 family F420-dependent LLM class oxidoreductase [Chloroflexi bacterium]|nr:TIGR03619 family F420-dependent LLM class oxidoreductase [Chloroflexota bacterium]